MAGIIKVSERLYLLGLFMEKEMVSTMQKSEGRKNNVMNPGESSLFQCVSRGTSFAISWEIDADTTHAASSAPFRQMSPVFFHTLPSLWGRFFVCTQSHEEQLLLKQQHCYFSFFVAQPAL